MVLGIKSLLSKGKPAMTTLWGQHRLQLESVVQWFLSGVEESESQQSCICSMLQWSILGTVATTRGAISPSQPNKNSNMYIFLNISNGEQMYKNYLYNTKFFSIIVKPCVFLNCSLVILDGL